MQRNSGIFISIFSLCNGILGASILILPVLALKDGFLLVPFILIFLGFSSGYTAYLLITHAKNHENMHDTVLYHFSNRNYMGIIYNLCIVISMFSSSMIYFSLAVKQVQGLISSNSVWISALLAIILIFLSIVQFYFHLGEKVMGLGAITIIVYLCFLVYAFVVTPSGQNKPVLVGQGTLDLGLSLIMALSCHQYVVYVLKRTTTIENYTKSIIIVFILCTSAYIFILSSFVSILNREPRSQDSQSILQYFPSSNLFVISVQIFYFIHFVTVIPEFSLVTKTRTFQVLSLDNSSLFQAIVLFVISFGIFFLVQVFEVKVSLLIQLNGAIISLINSFIFPAIIHLKCVYWDKNCTIKSQQNEMESENMKEEKEIQKEKDCLIEYKSIYTKYLQLVFLIIVVFFITFSSLFGLFKTLFQPTVFDSDL